MLWTVKQNKICAYPPSDPSQRTAIRQGPSYPWALPVHIWQSLPVQSAAESQCCREDRKEVDRLLLQFSRRTPPMHRKAPGMAFQRSRTPFSHKPGASRTLPWHPSWGQGFMTGYFLNNVLYLYGSHSTRSNRGKRNGSALLPHAGNRSHRHRKFCNQQQIALAGHVLMEGYGPVTYIFPCGGEAWRRFKSLHHLVLFFVDLYSLQFGSLGCSDAQPVCNGGQSLP